MITTFPRATACVAIVALLLGGCGGFQRRTPAPSVYRLFPPALAAGEAVPIELKIRRPVAAAGLSSDRVATLWPDGRIDYYRDARWGDELPRVVEAALVESLAQSHRLLTVHGDQAPFLPTHLLHVDIRRFEADYSAGTPPVVRITLGVTLGLAHDRRVLAAFESSAEAPAAANTQAGVMRAFNVAFGRVAEDLSTRLLEAVRSLPVAAP